MAGLDPDDFEHIVFFTGAGLSAEAGIPTYRGADGIWKAYDWQTCACQSAFEAAPDRVWDFHDVRRRVVGAARPTRGHEIIAAVAARRPSTRIVTQNIDGLQQRAGTPNVIELHGSLWRVRCACDGSPSANTEVPIGDRHCPVCGSWRRPDIVWFGDTLQPGPVDEAMLAFEQVDLLISIGTSGVVYPAAEFPQIARQRGALLVEINPEETPVSKWYPHHFRKPASAALTELWPDL